MFFPFLLFFINIFLLILSKNILMIWISLFFNTLASILFLKEKENQIMMKYFVIQEFGSLFILIGLIFIQPFIFLGIMIKIGSYPFQNWMINIISELKKFGLIWIWSLSKFTPCILILFFIKKINILMFFFLMLINQIFLFNFLNFKLMMFFSSLTNFFWMIILSFFNLFSSLLFFVVFIWLNNSNLFLDRLNFSFKIEIKDFLLSEKIFLLILLINFCGLSGSWESFSGWPLISISMSIFCWIIVLIRWMNKNIFDLLSHLTPSNLSFISILGLTLIEILSNMIRPLTLGMRLCANILGGHLILDLMSEMGIGLIWKMFLVLYESFVCFMQSLIFSLLLLSYFEEGSF